MGVPLKQLAALNVIAYDGVAPATPVALPALPAHQNVSNFGALIDIELDLPAAVAGRTRDFFVLAAFYLKVKAPGGVTIYFGSYGPSAVAGFFRSNTPGASVTLTALSATVWVAHPITGTWLVDA